MDTSSTTDTTLTKTSWCADTGQAATASKARQSVLEESEDDEEEPAAEPAGGLHLPCMYLTAIN